MLASLLIQRLFLFCNLFRGLVDVQKVHVLVLLVTNANNYVSAGAA